MKYSESNKPMECMMTQSTCYRGTKIMKPLGVLWHSTGANNPELRRYVQPDDDAPNREEMLALIGKNQYNNDYNHKEIRIGLNAWIGQLADGSVTTLQVMPWNFSPWGCGAGDKGSCNNGWIQFEICEDNLKNKSYFDAVYKEACELTAYLCKMFNLDPHGIARLNGVEVPVILCHYDSHNLGLGSNHGDVYHWFNKYGKTMDDVRNDVAKLMENGSSSGSGSVPAAPSAPSTPPVQEMYRVRKTWEDAKSQIGAYRDFNNAVSACNKAGNEYHVYDSNGNQVYPKIVAIKAGDLVSLTDDAVYYNGGKIPSWVKNQNWYVSEIVGDRAVIDDSENGKSSICSPINKKYLKLVKEQETAEIEKKEEFAPYLVEIAIDLLNYRQGPGTNYSVNGTVKKGQVFTIVAEDGEWGKLKSGAGWIYLPYTNKL